MTTLSAAFRGEVVALCGGVGGAKLAFGLSHLLRDRLSIVVNTGDDFEHLGLCISPDIDTVLYTLSGIANRELGWGRLDETWNFMAAMEAMGGETWFRLGDRDLALHVERSRRLRGGDTLTKIISDFSKRMGIDARVLPMSDDAVRTMVNTSEGILPFQRYFVERRCGPRVKEVFFDGCFAAVPSPGVVRALASADLRAIIICPSNPFLSIDPIFSVSGLRRCIENAAVPVVAISPIIAGKAVKGPTDKIMSELGLSPNSITIDRHYHKFIDGLIIDRVDENDIAEISAATHVTQTLMRTDEDRVRLAAETLQFIDRLSAEGVDHA